MYYIGRGAAPSQFHHQHMQDMAINTNSQCVLKLAAGA